MPQVVPLSDWTGAVPGLGDALECATEGSRVVAVIAPDDIDAGAASTIGLAEGDSAVAVVDVRKVYLPKADGRDQFVEGRGLPTVVRASDGTPGIMIPDAAPPDEVVVQVLKKGDGEVVTGDDPVRVHYTGVTWAEKEVFDTSWGKEPVSLTVEGVVEGFGQALEGQTVGSQILVGDPAGGRLRRSGAGQHPGEFDAGLRDRHPRHRRRPRAIVKGAGTGARPVLGWGRAHQDPS